MIPNWGKRRGRPCAHRIVHDMAAQSAIFCVIHWPKITVGCHKNNLARGDGAEPLRRMGSACAGTTIFVLKISAQREFPIRYSG
jgi:hypothetical protein